MESSWSKNSSGPRVGREIEETESVVPLKNVLKTWALAALALAILAAGVGWFFWCKPPVLIGFVGPLTGRNAAMGIQARNGALLAVELTNSKGGVAGRELELFVKDEGDSPESARAADRELLGVGVVAIVGHVTSSQAMAALPEYEGKQTVLISPTVTTPELTGKKDNFFRILPDNRETARALAKYVWQKMNLDKAFLLADSDNASFAGSFNEAFSELFVKQGGAIQGKVEFSSRAGQDWEQLVRSIEASGAQVVVVSASARDASKLAQAIAAAGSAVRLVCSSWSMTGEALASGGKAMEGAVFSTSYMEDSDNPTFREFATRYERRFGWPPDFAAAFSYEAVQLLVTALGKTQGKREGLDEALLSGGVIRGVVEDFKLDPWGDVERNSYIVSVRDGKFVILERSYK
jgi:branched-chain amino acid transport system substrate-binding protein